MDGPATGQDPDPLAVLAIELELASLDGGAFGISSERRISFQRTNIELPSDIRQARDQLVGRRIAQDASHGRIRAQDTPVMRDSPHSLEGILVDAAVVLSLRRRPSTVALSLSVMILNAFASAPISSRDRTVTFPSKCPSATRRAAAINRTIGRVRS